MDMACWGLIPRFWVKDKGFKEDDAIWGDQKTVAGNPPAEATELREGAFVAKILCDDREEEMEGVATCLDSVTIQLCEREAELAGLRGRVRFTSEPTV